MHQTLPLNAGVQQDGRRLAPGEYLTRFGTVNAVFNNAGIVHFSGVAECTPEDFKRITDVNLYGVFLGIHFCVPALRRAGGGGRHRCSANGDAWFMHGEENSAAGDLSGGAPGHGDTVELRNFGVFKIEIRKERIGRNPKDPGVDIRIPARKVVKFRSGKEMKNQLDAAASAEVEDLPAPEPGGAGFDS